MRSFNYVFPQITSCFFISLFRPPPPPYFFLSFFFFLGSYFYIGSIDAMELPSFSQNTFLTIGNNFLLKELLQLLLDAGSWAPKNITSHLGEKSVQIDTQQQTPSKRFWLFF
eukprot:TRINITY_DN5819_c0_g3_i1.p1 TRINITY_DN5819_c0_g3~~TRINITY_DN5819_c0_g3_i1.p1  ORF type:complete len:112 (+),score=6.80 TRINITY_DN5819_c0_g3_i1:188-523(+)